MKLTSEIILNNLDKLESLKKDFKLLDDYSKENDSEKLRNMYSEGRPYGFISIMSFIDFIRHQKKLNQEVFYNKKITIKEFQDMLVKNAADVSVKKILKSKGKKSFEKLINSSRWELYSGNKRRRGGLRYSDNFLPSTAIIANFCIQNQIEIEDQSRISEWYTRPLPSIDTTIKKEIDLTNQIVDYMFDSLSSQNYDFRRINVENITKFIQLEIERKMKQIEEGESVKLIETTDYYSGLSQNKVYVVKSKDISSGRLTVSIQNDLGFTRSYPYRIFETVSNLRNSALDELLNDL
jgi:hypothetical protein